MRQSKYIDVASTTTVEKNDNVGVNVGVNVGINVGIKERILDYIANYPQITASQLAQFLNVTKRTVERYMKELREEGKIIREGSDKTGYWRIK